MKPLKSALVDGDPLPGSRVNGQLTDSGREFMESVGKLYRNWLVEDEGFVSSYFDPGEWNIRSTGAERTIESGQYLMKGVYPGDDDKDRKICSGENNDKNCDAIIPILSYNLTNDPYLDPWDDCVTIQDKWEEILASLPFCESEEILFGKTCSYEVEEEIYNSFQRIATKLGLGYLDFTNLEYAFDPLITQYTLNQTYPANITEEEYNLVIDRYEYATKHRFLDDETVTELLASGLIHYIITDLEEANNAFVNGKDDYQQVSYYSAHDNTIMGFLASLGFFEGIPDFGARLEIVARMLDEPISNDPTLYINVSLYEGLEESGRKEILLNGRGCSDENNKRSAEGKSYCKIDSFISDIMSVSIPMDSLTEYNKMCSNAVSSWWLDHLEYNANLDKTTMDWQEIAIMVSGIVLALAAIITGLLLFCEPLISKIRRTRK